MATKTKEQIAAEAFKQELLNTSDWGLRMLATGPKGASVDVARMKEADAQGPETIVDLIMEKYHEGWRPGGVAVNPQADETKEATPVAKKRGAAKKQTPKPAAAEPAPEESRNPWDDFGDDDDDGSDGLPTDLSIDDEEKDTEPEPAPEPEKPKAAPRTRATAPTQKAQPVEMSAMEEKTDKILDTLMKMAAVISKLEKSIVTLEKKITVVDGHIQRIKYLVVEGKETATVALGVLFKKTPIKGFNKIVERAKAAAEKECGVEKKDKSS